MRKDMRTGVRTDTPDRELRASIQYLRQYGMAYGLRKMKVDALCRRIVQKADEERDGSVRRMFVKVLAGWSHVDLLSKEASEA
jgi:hypothetical protein